MAAPCPVLGFAVQLALSPAAEIAHLWSAFQALLGQRGLVASEGAMDLEYLVASEGGQATEQDREAVTAWLRARSEIAEYAVGPLVDLERDAIA